ncbi:acyltransferase family protein [Microbacterium sediminicola]|uniref:Acyltransferase family protein n=1 Tax=Microbacterium sediminicola TaxID=415210 RepID=A0ABN2IL55_9MICO
MPPTSAAASSRLAGLDGLRAVAVILVISYHLFPTWWLDGGFIGVDVFFVISGFLITTLLLRERARTGRIRLSMFWRRRARRLLPALVALLIICSSAAWIIGGDVLVRLGAQLIGALTFSYNWIAIVIGQGYFGASTPELFQNLWSLGIEEQFYVLWPLLLPLVLRLRRPGARVTLAGIAAAASATWMGVIVLTTGDASRAYFGTDSHAFGLLAGVALAFGMHRALTKPPVWMQHLAVRIAVTVAGVAALAGIVVLALIHPTDTVMTFPLTLVAAVVGTVVVIAASVWPRSPLGPSLDILPLRWVGERSYGLYLWHWPIVVLLVAAVEGTAPQVGVPVWIGILALVLTVVISTISYRYLESPIRRRGFRATATVLGHLLVTSARDRWATVSVFLVAIALSAVTVTAALEAPTVSSGEAVVAEGQAALDEAAAAASTEPTPDAASTPHATPPPGSLADGAKRRPAPSPAPVSGSEVTAVGDSVMLAAAPALLDALPGIRIDAAVSRSSWSGPGIVNGFAASGALGEYLVIALGTNGSISWDAYEQMAAIAGPDRRLVLVNAYAPRDWIPGVNADIDAFAASHPGTVVADWSGAIAEHLDYLAGDRVHPGPTGGALYASTVSAALNRIEYARAIEAYLDEAYAWRLAHRDDARIAQ